MNRNGGRDRELNDNPIVFFVGENPHLVSPSATLARALSRHNINSCFGATAGSGRDWWKLALSSDAVILVDYGHPGLRDTIRLTLFALSGRPLIRWWVGSDVLNCLRYPAALKYAKYLDRFTAVNVAVAPHLVEELTQVGLKVTFIPSVLDSHRYQSQGRPSGPPARGILAYLSPSAGLFYGEEVVRRAIEANPDIQFLIVGENTLGMFSQYSNAKAYGLVEDMPSVYSHVGCLLRVTAHDGLPRMVLESLLQGKYVIYSWPLDGCWLARNFPQVQAAIERFRLAEEPNYSGIEAARRLLDPDPAQRFSNLLRQIVRDQHGRLNWWRVLLAAPPFVTPLLFDSLMRKLRVSSLLSKMGFRQAAEPQVAAGPDGVEQEDHVVHQAN